ncbi:hypothetical protein NPX13_g6171 [Xylaria arbuscula]|uniref:Terpene synthase n=1 Tax=Xylaria arbuscula TaxID=114810 RepID=A0A9W8ND23_9PEZI|nr:hypothetical protein NPX13_g6171 [Xylaria arbuscula]
MEYRYSYLVDPTSYDSRGLCDGIPLRVHRNSDLEKSGVARLRDDGKKYTGRSLDPFVGCIGPVYSFTTVVIPECLPTRLEIVSYVIESAFLHDDSADSRRKSEEDTLDHQFVTSLNQAASQVKGKSESGQENFQINMVKELTSIDPIRAKELIAYWSEALSPGREWERVMDFEVYLEYRLTDCGSLLMLGLIIFGMGLTIPPEEKSECIRLTQPAWLAASLTNDVQSYDKEYKLHHARDNVSMANGIWVLMQQHSLDFEVAKVRVLQKIRYFVAKFTNNLENIRTSNLSLDSRRLVEASQYMVSGNLHWGMLSPRYEVNQNQTDL